MISPPAVICLLLKLVLKPPSHSYHTWQFVLCSYAVIKRLPFSLTAGWLRRRRHIFQQKVPFCRLRGLMSWGCTYCSGISSEITVALIRVERGRWLTVWMKINTNIISWIVEGFSPLDFFFLYLILFCCLPEDLSAFHMYANIRLLEWTEVKDLFFVVSTSK